ncbi:GerW family sporulation protein [Mycoplasmatota bacterium zrk1]
MEHPINNLLRISMENIKDMIDVNTIIGDPVTIDNQLIIPISKLKFGFAAGGTEQRGKDSDKLPFGGGSGGSVSINPIAFLVLKNNSFEVLHLEKDTHLYEKLIDFVPKLVNQFEEMMQKRNSPK